MYIYFDSLPVSSNLVLIIRRVNCINTTSGIHVCHCVGDHPVCIPDGYLHRVTCTGCCIDTIDSPDDEHKVPRNRERIEINIHKRNCASSWLFIGTYCLLPTFSPQLHEKREFQCISLHFTSLHFTSLHFTSLHKRSTRSPHSLEEKHLGMNTEYNLPIHNTPCTLKPILFIS